MAVNILMPVTIEAELPHGSKRLGDRAKVLLGAAYQVFEGQTVELRLGLKNGNPTLTVRGYPSDSGWATRAVTLGIVLADIQGNDAQSSAEQTDSPHPAVS